MDVQESKLDKMDAEADKLWQTHYGEEEVKQDEKKVEEAVAADTPKEEAPVVEEKEAPVVEEKAVPAEDTADYKQKYKTLEGKYRAEVPRLNEDVKKWKDTALNLNTRISELEAKLSELQQTSVANETDTDINQLTTDYPDIGKVVKKLKDGYEAKIDALEKKIQAGVSTEISTVKEDVAESRRRQFDVDMAAAGVPDWKVLDVDEGFNAWLTENVPYTRITKLDALKDAASKLDVESVSRFFLDYKATIGKEAQQPNDGQGKLEKFVAPSTAKVGTGPHSTKQPWLTQAEYTKFMQESAKGKFHPSKWGGKTEEQVESMFDAAIAEGSLR